MSATKGSPEHYAAIRQRARGNSPWTEEKDAQLIVLWAEGHSTAEIGRRLGFSKNAVVGHAHRMHLPARPSPITGVGVRKARPAYRPAVTLPALAVLTLTAIRVSVPKVVPPRPVERRVTAAWQPPAAAIRVPPLFRTCQWPTNSGEGMRWAFCDDPAVISGHSYCAAHCAAAYRRVVDRREDAASCG